MVDGVYYLPQSQSHSHTHVNTGVNLSPPEAMRLAQGHCDTLQVKLGLCKAGTGSTGQPL